MISLKHVALTAFDETRMLLRRPIEPEACLILCYHNIVPDGTRVSGERVLHTELSTFARQLAFLRTHFEIVSLSDLLLKKRTKRPQVAVTFDDAYAGALKYGLAECERLDVPSTVFVAPGILGSIPVWDALSESGRWNEGARSVYLTDRRGRGGHINPSSSSAYNRIADEKELYSALRFSGAVLGNHTMSHCNLEQLTIEESVAEVQLADEWLVSFAGGSYQKVLAYPYGLAPQSPSEVQEQTNMKASFLVSGGWTRPPFDGPIPRWNVPSHLRPSRFQLALRGDCF